MLTGKSLVNNFKNDLRTWVVSHHISQSAVNGFLKILRTHGHCMPNDCRTLMNTPRNTSSNYMYN